MRTQSTAARHPLPNSECLCIVTLDISSHPQLSKGCGSIVNRSEIQDLQTNGAGLLARRWGTATFRRHQRSRSNLGGRGRGRLVRLVGTLRAHRSGQRTREGGLPTPPHRRIHRRSTVGPGQCGRRPQHGWFLESHTGLDGGSGPARRGRRGRHPLTFPLLGVRNCGTASHHRPHRDRRPHQAGLVDCQLRRSRIPDRRRLRFPQRGDRQAMLDILGPNAVMGPSVRSRRPPGRTQEMSTPVDHVRRRRRYQRDPARPHPRGRGLPR